MVIIMISIIKPLSDYNKLKCKVKISGCLEGFKGLFLSNMILQEFVGFVVNILRSFSS